MDRAPRSRFPFRFRPRDGDSRADRAIPKSYRPTPAKRSILPKGKRRRTALRAQDRGRPDEGHRMSTRSLVAVVDDDESVRESLPDLVRQFGFAAQAFSSAEAFLASEVFSETRC